MKPRRKRGARAEAAPSDGMRIDYVPLDEVSRWPANPKRHDEAGIADSIDRFGYVAPLLLDETSGRIVAGHGRLDALQARQAAGGAPPGRVRVDARGRWLVPVVRGLSFASEAEADAYLIADNALSERGGWDHAALLARVRALAAGAGLRGTGYDDEAVRELAAKVAALTPKPAPGDDDVPEPPAEPVSRRGDMWILGEHRLLCGDSTKAEDVARVMGGERAALGLHDPPYGIGTVEMGFGDGQRHGNAVAPRGKFRPIAGDTKPFDPAYLLGSATVIVLWGANHYADRLPPKPAWLVWDKRVALPSNDFSDCELAWVSTGIRARIIRHTWNGMIRDSERGEARVHPTQKPVAVYREIVEAYTETGDLVADWYAGSGTTIIAAEQLGRRCYAVEIEPCYVDCAVTRWERMTGAHATLDGTGRAFAEVAAERRGGDDAPPDPPK